MRTDQDALHKTSSERIHKAHALNKECAFVRKSLRKYVSGQVFTLRKLRIERHLKSCVACASACQALRWEKETRLILKDITPPEGLVRSFGQIASGMAHIKKLLYRPLMLFALAALVAAGILAVLNNAPRQGDAEIESLEKALPPARLPAAPPPSIPEPAPVQAPAPAAEPLVVSVTPENDQAARRGINEAMQDHVSLRGERFSASVAEVSGTLKAEELQALLDRIASVGKIRYSRRHFESFPPVQPIPFILKLKPAPKPVEPPRTPPAAVEQKPSQPAVTQPASAPTPTSRP
jgi:hypothetical protein